MYTKRQILLTLTAFLFFFLIGWKGAEYYYLSQFQLPVKDGTTQVTQISSYDNPQSADLSLFWTVWGILDNSYLETSLLQNDQELIYGSIKGLVNSLEDPYTVFMTPEETKQFEENLNGQLEGIGAELGVQDGFLIVLSPLKDSPAEKAGLLPGDIIFQIEGEPTGEMTLFEAIMKIRGQKGTPVTLTIIRADLKEPFDVTIIRDEITVESVTFEILEGNVAYVSINQFSDNTGEEFNTAVQEILLKNPKGVVLDLRFNGGGYLDISVDILSEFISGEKTAVMIQTRNDNGKESFYVYDNARLPDIPLVVLVNEGSASASEIVAGAIQDHKRGLVMGKETFGKGSVQEVELLEDGSSLRLTIAKWLTPSGRDIEEVGIMPDRTIELTYEDIENNNDTQLEEARKYLENL